MTFVVGVWILKFSFGHGFSLDLSVSNIEEEMTVVESVIDNRMEDSQIIEYHRML